jgi:hypothetical protein
MQAPTWKELGEAYAEDDQVAIAHVDCTVSRNVCTKMEVRPKRGGACG